MGQDFITALYPQLRQSPMPRMLINGIHAGHYDTGFD
jgi:hypothetical protein